MWAALHQVFPNRGLSRTYAPVADIVLTTFNAKFAHASLGLRALRASLGELRDRSVIREVVCGDKPSDVVERLLEDAPKIIGVGVYVWNATASRELVRLIKQVAPEVVVVIGGPEVSHEVDGQAITAAADYVVTGEGETAFAALCAAVLAGARPSAKVHQGGLPDLATLPMPYEEYTDADLAHRVVYVEASRGCPFTCEFCLSSLDERVRNIPLERFLPAMETLLARGVRQFKFIDRTFNLKVPVSTAILEFFLERYTPDLFVHFEMVPDRLPDALRTMIAKFPPGALQFEVGIQTFDTATSALISRRQDLTKLADNFGYLRAHTGVHIHADLIVGLPGESVESFARGFDRLVALDPHEIQVGILKRLRGTPIARHTVPYGMVYSEEPPYEVLRTDAIDFATMQRMKRFAKVWEMVGNSGHFKRSRSLFWGQWPVDAESDDMAAAADEAMSPFDGIMAFTAFVFAKAGRTHAVALERWVEMAFEFLTEHCGLHKQNVASILHGDYARSGRKKLRVLADLIGGLDAYAKGDANRERALPRRQALHLP